MRALAFLIVCGGLVGCTQLSDVAKAACAAQQAVNAAEQIAGNRGNAAWAARFGYASQLTGAACTW